MNDTRAPAAGRFGSFCFGRSEQGDRPNSDHEEQADEDPDEYIVRYTEITAYI